MSSAQLQKIFRTLGDPTRTRILALLEREELAVQELMDVLAMAQSRVSRHLGILREAGLVRDRRDGTFSLYRFEAPTDEAWRDAWALASKAIADEPATERDAAALARVIGAREGRDRGFFDTVGGEWDALRKVWGDELLRARAINYLVPRGLRVADFGTGTGVLALELAEAGCDVIAIDRSAAMLDAARRKVEDAGVTSIEFREGDDDTLPLSPNEVDAAYAHMVLQYLSEPETAIARLAQGIRPGGRIVLIDFVAHDRTWMRDELGVLQMGFSAESIEGWLRAAGFVEIQMDVRPAATRGADLPATFVAHARIPESTS